MTYTKTRAEAAEAHATNTLTSAHSFKSGADWAMFDSELVRELVGALKKAQNIVVEETCEECGTFWSMRYEIKPITELLASYEAAKLEIKK